MTSHPAVREGDEFYVCDSCGQLFVADGVPEECNVCRSKALWSFTSEPPARAHSDWIKREVIRKAAAQVPA